MPRRSPFTLLCQTAAKLACPRRFDLHTHTTASDGDFTPSQLVLKAWNAGLAGLAITDHDTTAGLADAREALANLNGRSFTLVTGTEMTTRWRERELHLLAYDFREDHEPLQSALANIRAQRRARFHAYLDTFRARGLIFPTYLLQCYSETSRSVGRRNLAKLLVSAGFANNTHIAFLKYILPANIPATHGLPVECAIALIQSAGGFTSLAHPPHDMDDAALAELRAMGLDALETNSPSVSYSLSEELKSSARMLGIGCTAGSDYHGNNQTLGSRSISSDDFEILRDSLRQRRL